MTQGRTIVICGLLLGLLGCAPTLHKAGGADPSPPGSGELDLKADPYQWGLTQPQPQYNAPLKGFLWTPREQDFFQRTSRALLLAGLKELPHDGRLTLVARDIARYYRDHQRLAPLWYVQFALQKAGSTDIGPFYRVLRIKGEEGEALHRELIAQAREILGEGKTHLGVTILGAPHETRYMAMVAVEKELDLQPIPKVHTRGAPITIEGRALDLPEGCPLSLHIGFPEGETRTTLIHPQGDGTFSVTSQLPSLPGRYRVEISQRDGLWSKPLGLFFLYVDAQPPVEARTPYSTTSQEIWTSEGWANRLLELINWDRQYFGASPIRLDQSLSALARADSLLYSQEKDPLGQGKTLARHLQVHHIPALEAHAVVGSARSVEELHSTFMNTPSFRARIINPQITHVGIGVRMEEKEDGEQVYHVLEYFSRLIEEADPLQWMQRCRALLRAEREKKGRPPLQDNPRLQAIASEFIQEIFTAQRLTPDILPRLRQAVVSEGFQGESAFDIKIVSQLEGLTFDPTLTEGDFTHVGLAVAQGTIKGRRGSSRLVGIVVIASSPAMR